MKEIVKDPINLRDVWTSYPRVGLNVVKFAKSVRVCATKLCQKLVVVTSIDQKTGAEKYSCPVHGVRNRDNMMWFEFETTAEFRKVGFQ